MTRVDGCTNVNESMGLHFFIFMVVITTSRRFNTKQNVKDALVRII